MISSYQTSNILVSGANGFIGQSLCEMLLRSGYKVRWQLRSIDRDKSLPSGIDWIDVGDIGPETDWTKALKSIDTVVHLAARVHIMDDTASDPLVAFRWVNVKGTLPISAQSPPDIASSVEADGLFSVIFPLSTLIFTDFSSRHFSVTITIIRTDRKRAIYLNKFQLIPWIHLI